MTTLYPVSEKHRKVILDQVNLLRLMLKQLDDGETAALQASSAAAKTAQDDLDTDIQAITNYTTELD